MLLDANPLTDIRYARRIRAVVLASTFLDRPALDRLLTEALAFGKTREQVKAELAQAQSGEIAYGETGSKVAQGESSKTRAEVRAEVLKAQAEGSMLRNGEV